MRYSKGPSSRISLPDLDFVPQSSWHGYDCITARELWDCFRHRSSVDLLGLFGTKHNGALFDDRLALTSECGVFGFQS